MGFSVFYVRNSFYPEHCGSAPSDSSQVAGRGSVARRSRVANHGLSNLLADRGQGCWYAGRGRWC
ncbi:UNVERIFIED_CONTAM: hypothetical protein Slati_4160500 [Sesamum latifolium]|uniref:Uncharacterized protein n=1 Tax=Sesamum latifolium TaxID=2727402 RepID=A0AAW2TC93_9LAMI